VPLSVGTLARVIRIGAGLVAALALAAALPAGAGALPPIKHVFVVVLENEDYGQAFGSGSKAPYLARTLRSRGLTLPNYYAIGHLSLDNYIAMISGQAPNPFTQTDCQTFEEFGPAMPTADGQYIGTGCVYPAKVKTIADQLTARGLRWKGYMEDMRTPCRHPAVNSPDETQHAKVGDQYAARHNPFVYFHSIIDSPQCARNDVDYRELARDVRSPRTTPGYAMIAPNLCNDGHDDPCVDDRGHPGGLPKANAWLRREIPELLASPGFRDNGLLIVTFDESDSDGSACCGEQHGPNTTNPGGLHPGPGGGKVGAVLVSPFVRPGSVVRTPFNHYSLLRSMEDLFRLRHLGYARQRGLKPFGSEVYNATPRLRVRVSRRRLPLGRSRSLRIRTTSEARIHFGGACGRKARWTDARGRLKVKIRPRHLGRCRILATRPAWRSARASVRVVRVAQVRGRG
jgi:phosphatidylinositol-3-phosphatase